MDIISIKELRIPTTIGVYEWEQKILQPIILDMDLFVDIAKCNDDLQNTIDYAKVSQAITEFVTSTKFALIEHLANEICAFVKQEFKIQKIKLRVCKPKAIANAHGVSITVER